jgi:hypothetical protein
MPVVEKQFEAAAPAHETSSGVALRFDSGPGPIGAGIRGGVAARRFSYQTAEYNIDLRIEPRRHARGARVVGQITNRSIANLQTWQGLGVCLLDGKSAIVATLTNRSGEFQLEFGTAASNLCLSISRDQLDEILLPLCGIQGKPPER